MHLAGSLVAPAVGLPPVRRLGLAARGSAELSAADIRQAIRAGIGYLHWSGQPDGVSEAVADLSPELRARVIVATQLYARGGMETHQELNEIRRTLGLERLDVAVFYYVESEDEWAIIARREGALQALRQAQRDGQLGAVGLTTHDLGLAAKLAAERAVDLLQIRYNAADRVAEEAIFPAALAAGVPMIAYTCLRWGRLLGPTPDDPPGFVPPAAPDWYRWVLSQPAVTLALCAPDNSLELAENLTVLEDESPPGGALRESLEAHGERVGKYTSAVRSSL